MQDRSRQDRQLEARAAALDENAQQLNLMIAAVVAMIVLVVVLLYVFDILIIYDYDNKESRKTN